MLLCPARYAIGACKLIRSSRAIARCVRASARDLLPGKCEQAGLICSARLAQPGLPARYSTRRGGTSTDAAAAMLGKRRISSILSRDTKRARIAATLVESTRSHFAGWDKKRVLQCTIYGAIRAKKRRSKRGVSAAFERLRRLPAGNGAIQQFNHVRHFQPGGKHLRPRPQLQHASRIGRGDALRAGAARRRHFFRQ